MITADDFLKPARERGFDFYTGVPCSFLTPLINAVIGSRELTYVGAASEGEAVAIASGAWLAGRKTVVICQNSGLGNTVNPLTSLNHPFKIPTLMVVTWRGQPGLKDEPQHVLMGQITDKLLDVIRVPHASFPVEAGAVEAALDAADKAMAKSELPYAFIMAQGTVRDDGLHSTGQAAQARRLFGCDARWRSAGARGGAGAAAGGRAGAGRDHRHHRQDGSRALHAGRPAAASLPGRRDGGGERHGAGRRPQCQAQSGRAGWRRRRADEARHVRDHRGVRAQEPDPRRARQRRA